MRRVLSTIIILIWGLWFGGVIALFLAVTSLFSAFADRHDLAGRGAAHIFRAFNRYQLALAAASLLATFAWRILGPPRLKTMLFTLFALATVAACMITMYLAPRIELLSVQGLTQSSQFAKLHGYSMGAYCAEAVILLIAGMLLPSAISDQK